MTVRCKNTYGDGSVEYVEYVVAELVTEDDEEATTEDHKAAQNEGAATLFERYGVQTT